jgi:hypothetical protein
MTEWYGAPPAVFSSADMDVRRPHPGQDGPCAGKSARGIPKGRGRKPAPLAWAGKEHGYGSHAKREGRSNPAEKQGSQPPEAKYSAPRDCFVGTLHPLRSYSSLRGRGFAPDEAISIAPFGVTPAKAGVSLLPFAPTRFLLSQETHNGGAGLIHEKEVIMNLNPLLQAPRRREGRTCRAPGFFLSTP